MMQSPFAYIRIRRKNSRTFRHATGHTDAIEFPILLAEPAKVFVDGFAAMLSFLSK
jgi:hypothetical protein